jgi:hypothetical protein
MSQPKVSKETAAYSRALFEKGQRILSQPAQPGKQNLVSITQGGGFADADADIRSRRRRLHESLDEVLDNGDSNLLAAVSNSLEAYGAMVKLGVNVRGGSR